MTLYDALCEGKLHTSVKNAQRLPVPSFSHFTNPLPLEIIRTYLEKLPLYCHVKSVGLELKGTVIFQ